MCGFIIYIENEVNKQWTVSKVFTLYNNAQNYLYSNGFKYNSGIYVKDSSNWNGAQKAYISRVEMC